MEKVNRQTVSEWDILDLPLTKLHRLAIVVDFVASRGSLASLQTIITTNREVGLLRFSTSATLKLEGRGPLSHG